MKRFLAPFALVMLPFLSVAQDLPAPSPSASVMQRVGLADITVNYSRPSVKGRRIFGDLVPMGQVWRTGANHCTVFETTGFLIINGQKLPAGKYALFTIPGEDKWEVIFNKNTDLWGADEYNAEEDVLKIQKAVVRPAPTTESFMIFFENLKDDKAEMILRWEKSEVVLEIEAPSQDQAMANIKEALSKDDADYRTYARSASFCVDRGIEPKMALEWAQKSVGMEKKYWNTFTLAKAQASMNMYAEAVATGKEAVTLAGAEKDGGAQKSYQAKVDEWTRKAAGK